MRLPVAWSRTRATAVTLALALHAVMAGWLLALRFELPDARVEHADFVWVPVPVAAPPPADAMPSELPPPDVAPITAPPLPMPRPEVPSSAPADWSQSARDVAKGLTTDPTYRRFGEVPEGPPERPKERYPPSIWPEPLARVGKTVVTPDGETIIWVSDYCFVSISSRSIALKDIHDGRQGVRTCVLAQFGDKKKARSDLFDPIKRPPPPQEPGCDKDGVGQSCGR